MKSSDSYDRSIQMNLGRESSKEKWSIEAKKHGLIFLCKDAERENNAWYKFVECGHIKSINISDVKRGKFSCKECREDKYAELCKLKNIEYIGKFTRDNQTIIKGKCNICSSVNEYRASSITHHDSTICTTCQTNKWKDVAEKYGFTWIKRFDSTYHILQCNECGVNSPYRMSDVYKGEMACVCKSLAYLEELKSWGRSRGFELVKKIDHSWSIYKCVTCSTERKFQHQAMRTGNVSCHECKGDLSHGQRLLEDYLKDKGYSIEKEVKFEDLRGINKGRLRYDIGIIENGKIICLIEYDGCQHFHPHDFGKVYNNETKEANLAYVQKHDRLKNDYAERNNIPLLRIGYNSLEWEAELKEFLNTIEEVVELPIAK